MSKIVFVMGMTNSGKTTFMAEARKNPEFGTIEVGKLMRAKYPPEHFAGQDAPKHTAVEAWQMLVDGLAANKDKRVVFVDGQPRDIDQADASVREFPGAVYGVLYASREIRLRRAIERDGASLPEETKNALISGAPVDLSKVPAALSLSLKRMTSDYASNYQVLAVLGAYDIAPYWVHTDDMDDYSGAVGYLATR